MAKRKEIENLRKFLWIFLPSSFVAASMGGPFLRRDTLAAAASS